MNRFRLPVLVLILLSLFCIPTGAVSLVNASDTTGPAPVWSDQIGESDIGFGFLVAVSGDGRYIVSGSDTGKIRFYNNLGDILWTARAPPRIWDLQISRNGEYIAAATSENIFYFNRSGNLIGNYSFMGGNFRVVLSGDGRTIVIPRGLGLSLINATTGQVKELPCNAAVAAVAISDDGRYIAAGTVCRGGQVFLFDSKGDLVWSNSTSRDAGHCNGVRNIQLSQEGGIVMAEDTGKVFFFTSNGDFQGVYSHDDDLGRPAVIKLSDSGEFAVVYSSSKVTYIEKTGKPLWNQNVNSAAGIRLNPYSDGDVSLSGDGQYVAVTDDYYLSVYDRGGRFLWRYHLPSLGRSVALSHDGKYIAMGTQDSMTFFNIDGTPTMPEPVITQTSPVPKSVPVTTGTPRASLPVFIVMLALGVGGIIYGQNGKDW
ncbi:MAG: WD40 repeat domain-containing protein [Methanoregula sp.]|nr:WD40 repeat domain-containing protein [Methanoregula sp.]